MKTPSAKLRRKIKQDHALSLSELAIASGWDRGALARMDLPLECGKIAYSDFRRVLNFRQQAHERHRSRIPIPIATGRPLPRVNEGPRSAIGRMADELMVPRNRPTAPKLEVAA